MSGEVCPPAASIGRNAPGGETQQTGFLNVIVLTAALKVWWIYLSIKNSP